MKTWKIIPIAPDYEISTSGDVRRIRGASGTQAGRVLKPMLNPVTGYLEVAPRVSGATVRSRVHRLMARTYLGESALEVNHKNGKKTDNRLVNLEYATRRENHDHAMHTLNSFWTGSRVPQSKLKESDIPIIWSLRREGHSYSEIGRRFGVNHVSILKIFQGKTWRRVSETLASHDP